MNRLSKFMSKVLRHSPEYIGIKLDAHGWVSISDLITGFKTKNFATTEEEIREVVRTCPKQRYEVSGDLIRAVQGHSINIDLELCPETPPPVLYHGTVEKNLPDIMKYGLKPMSRQHVHMTDNITTAKKVGARYGVPIILKIDTSEGVFYRSKNGVWLADHIPSKLISVGTL